ncbi:MAG: single-stranded DNA-binding protein [Rhodospirillaceae bacterium]|nr:single-stranded DNA-binding protein [Rhodospirillaceae bacterium]
MFALNVVTLAGRLGSDAEIKSLSGGNRVATFNLAVDRNVKGPSGKWKTETYWFRVVTYFPYLIDLLADTAKKGCPVLVQGALRARSWEQDGEKKHLVEVEVDGNGGVAFLAEPMSVNTVTLIGRLGDNATIRTLPGNKGSKIATMSVAVGRGYKDANGEWPSDWLRLVTFQPSLIDKTLAKQATKGRLVMVQGALRAREWEDTETGEVKTSYEVEVETSTGIVPVLEKRKEKANG